MTIVEVDDSHADAIVAFFERLTDGDRTFIKEELGDAESVLDSVRADRRGGRWVAVDDDRVVGYLAVLPLTGWSDHVAEIRLVVDPAARGTGIGRALARQALRGAVDAGRTKVVVELVADQTSALAMFTDLGFTGEALLRDHIRDREGELRDLIMLAHYVEQTQTTMHSLGLADELG